MRNPAHDPASVHAGRFGLLPSLLEEFFQPAVAVAADAPGAFAIEIEETPNAYRVLADLPGVDKNDIQIDLHENTLTITAERREERSAEGRVLWSERRAGKLARTIQLPQAVDAETVQAKQVNGTLDLTLQKQAASRTRRINIA
jgi:HSP20 family protein